MTDELIQWFRNGGECAERGEECRVRDVKSGCTCTAAADTITALRAELTTQIEWVKDLADNLATEEAKTSALRADNASLASWQCVYTDGKTGLVGDEHGNQFCAMAKRADALRAENERLRAAIEGALNKPRHINETYGKILVDVCGELQAALKEKSE